MNFLSTKFTKGTKEIGAGNRGLLASFQVFQCNGLILQLGIAEDEAVRGGFAVAEFELRFDGAIAEVHVGGDVVGAELVEQFPLRFSCGFAVINQIEEGFGGFGKRRALRFECDEESFEAGAEADAGGWAAAEVFDEVVIAAAAA